MNVVSQIGEENPRLTYEWSRMAFSGLCVCVYVGMIRKALQAFQKPLDLANISPCPHGACVQMGQTDVSSQNTM